jgi:hypothetical protein
MSPADEVPIGLIRTPKGATDQWEIKLLRLVQMVWIFGMWTERENAAG